MSEPELSKKTADRLKLVGSIVHYLLMASTFWLASGLGPPLAENVVAVILWALIGLQFFFAYIRYGNCWFSDRGLEISKAWADQRQAERGRWWWLHRILFFASVAALFWADRPALAAIFLAVFLFSSAAAAYHRVETVPSGPEEPLGKILRKLGNNSLVIGMLVVWVVLFIPTVIAGVPFVLVS